MRVGRVGGSSRPLQARPAQRRVAAALCAVAVTLLGLVSGGLRAQASTGAAGAGQAAVKAHGTHAPGPVHPAPVPQGAGPAAPVRAKQEAAVAEQPPAIPPPARYTPAMRAQLSAMRRAKATGKAVVVAALTTASSQVVARPDGRFEMTSDVYPVRFRRDGAWVAISTRLVARDGGWAPAAVAVPLVFSGGGSGPMVTVTASGKSARLWWPAPLPRPVVSGSVALYRGVLPGVDLRLKATSDGYSDVLIVRNAAAAASPLLRSLTERVAAGAGLSVKPGPGGSLVVRDTASGQPVLTFGRPLMWDSSRSRHFALPATADLAGSGRVTVVPAVYERAGAGSAVIVMRPPAAALRGRAVRYPLFIDPTTGDVKLSYYAQVMHGNTGYTQAWNKTTGTTSQPNGVTEVGFCGYSSCVWSGGVTSYTDRDYFQFPTSTLDPRNSTDATITEVDFNIEETGNSNGCVSQPSAVYSTTGGISSSTAWGGPQGSSLATASSDAGGGSSCQPGFVNFTSSSLKSTLQTVANNGATTVTLELRAVDESNELQYKTYLDTPTLNVYYNFPPNKPGSLTVNGLVQCTSTNYTPDTTPTMNATATDNNPTPLNLDYSFNVLDSSNTSHASSGWLTDGGPGWKSGTQASWTVPASAALSAGTYHFTAQARNVPTDGKAGALTSATATSGSFTVQTAKPATPDISSFDYPSGQWGQAEGEPGAFTVDSGAGPNVAGFAYSFDNSPTVPNAIDCNYLKNGGLGTSLTSSWQGGNTSGELQLVQGSTQEIKAPLNLTPGRHTLNVISFNFAHVPSAVASYVFYVPTNYTGVSTPYTTNGSTLVTSATGTNASLVVSQANCCNMTWPGSAQLRFAGTAAGQTFTVPITVPAAGTWHLGADMTLSFNYAQVRVDLDAGTANAVNLGGTAAMPFDGYSAQVSGTYLDLGTQTLTAGTHQLTFTATGTDAASTGYEIGLVDLQLSPTNRLEADALPASSTVSGQPHQQCLNEATWSDNCQLFFTNGTAGTSFTVTFNAPVESDYALGANLVTAKDYGTETFTLDPGTPSAVSLDGGGTFDAYTATVGSQYLFFGGVHLTAGPHVLQVTVTGQNASSSSYNAGINFIEVAPITSAKESSFTAAMNNQGIAYDDGTAAMTSNFDLLNTATGNNLSQQALASAGLITLGASGATGGPWTGSSFSLNGAQFTMPAPRVDSSGTVVADNVIPDGQMIPLPDVNASAVALLVTSTCHPAPEATVAIAYGPNASGGTIPPANPIIPSPPDWFAGVPGPTVISLSHYDTGSTVDTAVQPQLYEVMLPANPGYPLSTITLPVMPVNLLPDSGGCGVSANIMHILAIGTVPAASAEVPAANGGGVWTGAYDGPMDTSVTPDQALPNETLREVVPLSSAGSGQVRIHLSNAYSTSPVTFDDVTVAAQASGGSGATVATPSQLKFGSSNATSLTLAAGADAYSNPVAMPALASGSGKLTVSMHVQSGTTVTMASIHDSLQGLVTYYVAGADDTGNSDGTPFTSTNSLAGLFYLAGVDVSDTTATDGTVAVLGDQGAAAQTSSSGTWASYLPSALGQASPNPETVPGSIVDAATSDAMPDDWWRLNGAGPDGGSTAYDSGAVGTDNLTLKNSPGWTTARPGTGVSTGALSLNGTSQYGVALNPAITSSGSFAVSAWVDLSSVPAGDAVAVAQDGTSASEFYLGSHAGKWGFWFAGTDAASPALTGAFGAAATSGAWTMLTGVYNAANGQIKLYVNGTQAALTTFTPSWTATGPLTVGSGLVGGAQDDFLPGNVSDVRAYNRMVWGYNVQAIYNDTGMSSLSAANVASSFVTDNPGSSGLLDYESYAAGEPNLRDVIVSLGANDVLQGTSEATIENDLRTITEAITSWQVSDEPGMAVHVFLTTIAPLGLASADPRETVREDVNSWLEGNAGATANLPSTIPVFDVAGAVQDPANSNDINPGYLSGGVPTAAYFQQIATTVANGISVYLTGPPPVTW